MIGTLLGLVAVASGSVSPSNAVTSLCTSSSYGEEDDQFFLDVSKDGADWHVKIYPKNSSSWIPGAIVPDHNVIKILNGDNGQQVVFGQARGAASGRYFSITIGADVIGGHAVNFSVDVMSYADASYSTGYRRIVSADCKVTAGQLSVEKAS